jgi:hypothetical protein
MTEAVLIDAQRLLGVNDLFIGSRPHTSTRYAIELRKRMERPQRVRRMSSAFS